jgi:nucleoside-diphosphate-sugar epimerase
MRVVITGVTGNVGTSLIEVLGTEPEVDAIVGLARRVPRWQPPKTTWAAVDVSRDDLEPHFRCADAVVHLAWIFQPTQDDLATWRNNAVGSIRVFDAVADPRPSPRRLRAREVLPGADTRRLRAPASRRPPGPGSPRLHLQAPGGVGPAPAVRRSLAG